MRVRVGTSGFSYKEWKGTFYPEDLPDARMLGYYAERFDTVEINNTFYRMPKPSVVAGWGAEVPRDFSFALKAQGKLVHWGKVEELGSTAKTFFAAAGKLGPKLGPVLVALPGYQQKSLDKLRTFLAFVPKGVRVAFDVAHPSWHDEEVYAELRARGAALCLVDDTAVTTPLVATAPFGYLRLRKTTYGRAQIAAWAERILAQPWREAWVFLKHEDAATGPRLATALKRALARRAAAVVEGER
jgi:uncharacterized protein YecE (DUF72 family)